MGGLASPSSVSSTKRQDVEWVGESNVSMNPGVPCLGYLTLGG